MSVERAAGGTSLIDVLDRVLDKGIVIDAWVRVPPVTNPDSSAFRGRGKFGSIASSRSALPADDNDDDDDGGPECSGSSGAPAFDIYPLKPRRRPPSSRVTRRRR